jgi:hypothetical protein
LREIVIPDDFNTVSPSQLKRDRARELVALLDQYKLPRFSAIVDEYDRVWRIWRRLEANSE